ncbi:DEAD/DEAH box helicase [Akkermansia glycaniphila]|uniref:DEAD/DEAH box helicase n=1 Tax=Akkermansia glycaniphila TaxID=1679444 RepID=UPI001C0145B6|nr:DEAD/DEAH box helicase [Akkermansia glycaniphila]MBT9449512.1 DEAD/DEAH box helicase [Akkermansia glycaniphila]
MTRKIIVAVDEKWSRAQESCCLLFFSGVIKTTQKGILSGYIKKINPFKKDSISSDAQFILSFIENDKVAQINYNEFIMSYNLFADIAPCLIEKKMLYIKNYKHKFIQITDISIGDRLVLVANRISRKLQLPTVAMQEIYAPNRLVQNAEIRLQRIKGRLEAELSFPQESSDITSGIICDLKFQHLIQSFLHNHGFTQIRSNGYAFPLDVDEVYLINKLIEYGIIVYFFDGSQVHHSSHLSYKVTSDMDWFQLKFEFPVDDEDLNMTKVVIDNYAKGYVCLNGELVKLPGALREKRWSIKVQDNVETLLIKKAAALYLEEILEESCCDALSLHYIVPFSDIVLKVSAYLETILRKYQKDGVIWLKFLYLNQLGGILADDMGLGKTLQAIALCSDSDVLLDTRPVLVITMRSLVTNWKREINRFAPNLFLLDEDILKLPIKTYSANNIIVTTYGFVRSNQEAIKTISFKLVILDEIQIAKNSESQTYHSLKSIRAGIKIGLSGTPIENNLNELWSLLSIINPFLLGKQSDFHAKYSGRRELLRSRISPFLMRREKKEVLKELPAYSEDIVYCDMDDRQRNLYHILLREFKKDLSRPLRTNEIYDNSRWLRYLLFLREVCCNTSLLPRSLNPHNVHESAKLVYLQEKIKPLYHSGKKCVVFGQFIKNLRELSLWLQKEGINVFYLDGEVTSRQIVVDAFNQAERAVFVSSMKAGGIGLNLTSAQYAFIIDPWWNPAMEQQAADRLYRIGQVNPVTIYKLIVPETVEEKILELQAKKKEIFSEIIKGGQTARIDTMEELRKYLFQK